MRQRPPWFYRQSGVIPYRGGGEALEILLITKRRGGRLVIPKGVIHLPLTAAESARKEAYEEAGIEGTLSPRPIGDYLHEKWGGVCTVNVFLMQVERLLDTWPEATERERLWMTVDEAAAAIQQPELREMILRVPDIVHGKRA